mmetsp:Transcript_39618/g.92599  ORF Transcript_39618/g.92599 Transcript_39618/m.92599 type:complete len:212 (+) Transcript_39618:282-917(+)
MTAQLAGGRSVSPASSALIPASICATESCRLPARSQESKSARVSIPPGCMASRICAWFSADRSQRACEPPAAPCSRVEISLRVARSKRYRIGTELGTCNFGTSSSDTQSNAAMSERMVLACATTTTVRSRSAGSASSNIAGEILSVKHSSTRLWQSARLSVTGAGGGCHHGCCSASGGGFALMLRRHEWIVSLPKRACSSGSLLCKPCTAP